MRTDTAALLGALWALSSFGCPSRATPTPTPRTPTGAPTPSADASAPGDATPAGPDAAEADAEALPEPAPSGPSMGEKIDAFLRANLRVRARGPRPASIALRLRFDAQGNLLSGEVAQPSGSAAVDQDFTAQLRALVARRARLEGLTPDDAELLTERAVRINLPLDAIPH